nr:aldehyde dehydrogenase, conserved site-containing protein [Tanacetum cinerariifolium]GFC81833.1 aldehyde dehydrogenase, conserved site-containing protein [Tanacetum cinerariifolium]
MEPFTKEAILSLNNGLFHVDLSTFKARLVELNIFTWKEVDGSLVRVHGHDYQITINIKGMGNSYAVKDKDAFEDVIRMLEKELKVFPSNQTVDKDACDENAYDEDACDDDASDE